MSPDEKEFVEEYIKKLLQADLVEECTSVYCTPILVVPKPNHTPQKPSYRLVQDFRKVNKILTDIKYPIPDTQELIDSFQGKSWFSNVDCSSGYWQLTLDPESRDITAFDSPSGCRYRWKSLAMGLSVAPALYALAMDQILAPLKKKGDVSNYFDDISIGTESFEDHLKKLEAFFSLLREKRVKLNVKKSTFFQRQVQFLGMVLDGQNVTIPESRVRAITKMPVPKDKAQLGSALGVFGFNRRFIQNYSQIAAPLVELQRKDAEYIWTDKQQSAFDKLKSILSTRPALRLYDPHANNRIATDASYLGLGCHFSQQDPRTKRFHPVAFVSRKFGL